MAYTPRKTWVDNTNPPGSAPSPGATQILASDLAYIEQGIVQSIPSSGTKVVTGATRLESSVTGDHPLTVWADKADGGGMLERFTVENTSGGGGCDVNFRNVDLNVGVPNVGAYSAHMKFYCAPSTTVDTVRIFKPGSSTDLASKMTTNGSFVSYAKGVASGAAFSVQAWGDANQTFAVGAPDGKVSWGAGGATALDTFLYRSAAGVLKTDGKVAANAVFAGSTTLRLQDATQNDAVTVSATSVQFYKRVIFLADGSSVTMGDAGIVAGTGTGMKVGTATTQKIGFYGVAPVVQQARPTDVAGVIAALAALGLTA